MQAWRRLKRIEFLKLNIIVHTIAQIPSSAPKFDNVTKMVNELQSLIFPAIKVDREKSLAFASEVLDNYRGKPMQVTPVRPMREDKTKRRTFNLKK